MLPRLNFPPEVVSNTIFNLEQIVLSLFDLELAYVAVILHMGI